MSIDEIIEIAKQYGWRDIDPNDKDYDPNYLAHPELDVPSLYIEAAYKQYCEPPYPSPDEHGVWIGHEDDRHGWAQTPDHLHRALQRVINTYITQPAIRRGIAAYLRTTLAKEAHLAIEVAGEHRLFSVDDLCKALEG